MFQQLSRVTRHFFLFGLIVIAVMLTTIRVLVFCVDLYKHELEFKLSKLFAAPVTIGQLSAKMYRLHPQISLKNISIAKNNSEHVAISLKELRLGIDLVEVVLKRQIMGASWVSLIGAKLSVIRKKDGSFVIEGLKAGNDGQPFWLLQGERYRLLESEISWRDEKREGKTVTFKNIDLLIKNDPQKNHHQLHFLSQLASKYGKSLRVSVDIRGNIFEPENLNGEVYIAGKNIYFDQLLTGELPLKLLVNSGSGDFEVWGQIQQSELRGLTGNIKAQNLSVWQQDKKNLVFSSLSGEFKWLHQQENWQLAVQNLDIKANKTKWQAADFSIGIKKNRLLAANIKHIDLQLLSRLNQFFTPLFTEIPDALNKLTLRGELNNLLLFSDLSTQQYALKADFKQLGVNRLKDVPQFENLSGSIHGNEKQGYLTLASSQALITAKSIFRKPLTISKLTGRVNWQQDCDEWLISSDSLLLDTADLGSEHKLRLKIPKDNKSSFIDLQTAFYDIDDVSKLKRYFPINSMGKETLGWLDRAFVSGKVKRGDFVLYGELADFPFEKNQGSFQVLFETNNLELAYAEQWPNFKALNARVMFLNEGLDVKIKSAKAGKVSINKTLISIPSLDKSRYLQAKVAGEGRISDILNWLQQAPLDLPIKDVIEQVSVKGRGDLKVALKIPLTDEGMPKVNGSVKLKRASLNVRAIDLPVRNIKGLLKFDTQHFYSDKLQAFALGYPLTINIKDDSKAMTINVNGKTSIKHLQEHFEFPRLKFANGNSAYKLQLTLPVATSKKPTLQIKSNLSGISLDFPSSLGKKKKEKKSLSVLLRLNKHPLLPISVIYNQNLHAKLKLNKQEKKLHSGNILLGKGSVRFPTQKGLKITVNQRRFFPLTWLSLFNSDSKNERQDNLLRQISIKTAQLNWKKKKLGALNLVLKRENNNWRGSINSSFAKGRLTLPINMADAAYKLDMDYINLTALAKLSTLSKKNKVSSGKRLPVVEIHSKQLIWRKVNLGRLDLSSRRNGSDIYFDRIKLVGGQHKLSLTANWRLKNNREYTNIQGQLNAENFGRLLKKLDFNGDLKETAATIKLAANWEAAPHQASLSLLNGNLDLHLDEGRISSIEPGFGRLLGVLAMGQWIKRLQLDFGDIYKEGLSFNSIDGHYTLQKGIAYSNDLTVDAVPAKITLKGQLNLGAQTLDKEISVIPKSSAALPIAGTIVGSIATAIAQTLTGEYEEGFYLRSKYRVQGKWEDLEVTPLHEQDGLLQKTWRGLTDFSWLNE